jgi:hypothetical protein
MEVAAVETQAGTGEGEWASKAVREHARWMSGQRAGAGATCRGAMRRDSRCAAGAVEQGQNTAGIEEKDPCRWATRGSEVCAR